MKLFSSNSARTSLIKKNILGGALVKGCSILCSLLLVPMTISYISSELYGIWLTLASIVQWIGFFDIGFGNGLRNRLTTCLAADNEKLGKIYVSTTYFIMFIIFFLIAIISYFSCPLLNWASLLNISQSYNLLLISVVRIVVIAFCVQIVLKLIQNVIQSYQFNAMASALDMLGNILVLVFIFILTKTMSPDLRGIALCFSLAPLFVYLVCSIILYMTKFKRVSPNIKYIKPKYLADLFSLGGNFFLIQIASLVLYQMINILISRICGPEQVTVYNISYKYMNVSLMILNIILGPMWSAFTDAFTKKDYIWMTNIYKKLKRIYIYIILLIVVMLIVSPIVYRFWIGNKVIIPFGVSLFLALYFVIAALNNITTSIINGLGTVKIQLCMSIIMMFSFIPLASFLGNKYGLYGILFSMIIINIPNYLVQKKQVEKLLSQTANGIWNK